MVKVLAEQAWGPQHHIKKARSVACACQPKVKRLGTGATWRLNGQQVPPKLKAPSSLRPSGKRKKPFVIIISPPCVYTRVDILEHIKAHHHIQINT